jgi:uncharacterized repeat protein (TIGR03803 family)
MTLPSTKNRPVRAAFAAIALVLMLVSTSWAASEKVLYRFHGKDGGFGGSVIVGPDGKLYGTTVGGGGEKACPNSSFDGCGMVFQLTPGKDGKWRETILHAFRGGNSDGSTPAGDPAVDEKGNLYGTTVYGGPLDECSNEGCGIVFELTPNAGGKWTYKVVHEFAVTDGAWPYGGLIFDAAGNLYGTTTGGGNTGACTGGCGVVFELTPGAKGQWTESVLYSFEGTAGDGPNSPLIFDSTGNLYGATQHGGANGTGAVFELLRGKGGEWAEQVLYSFGDYGSKDGNWPVNGLTLDGVGNLYGATVNGGTKGQQGWGTVFKLTPFKNGRWAETILHDFDEYRFGGGGVDSGLILDTAGNLYGTAASGGKYTCPGNGNVACGVVFRLAPRSKGKWTETVLHSFGKGKDGAGPGGLVSDSAGHLFGVTGEGGYSGGRCGEGGSAGCGVAYEIIP